MKFIILFFVFISLGYGQTSVGIASQDSAVGRVLSEVLAPSSTHDQVLVDTIFRAPSGQLVALVSSTHKIPWHTWFLNDQALAVTVVTNKGCPTCGELTCEDYSVAINNKVFRSMTYHVCTKCGTMYTGRH